MFYILATNTKVQEELCQEIDTVLEGAMPNHDNMHHTVTPYLNGVVYEALRLYPPVPINTKTNLKDETLPDGTVLPANSQLLYCPYVMGRDATRYPDPTKVDPNRWIPFKQPSLFEFPVFQAGPRVCLGMNMALFEMKVAAVMLLRQYWFDIAPGEAEKIKYSINLTMSLANGEEKGKLWLIPKKRKSDDGIDFMIY